MVVYCKIQLRLIERRFIALHLSVCRLGFGLGRSYLLGTDLCVADLGVGLGDARLRLLHLGLRRQQ